MIDKSIFTEASILMDTNFSSQEEVFHQLALYFTNNGYCNNFEDIYKGFYDRESMGSTAFFDGLCIPHSKVDTIIKPGICIIKNLKGIEWHSLDDIKTNFFIALAIPNNESSNMHLKMLSSVARKISGSRL